MALQDNFNAIYNKTEQNKQQRELQKQQNKTFEIYLQEELQKAIESYCEENNKNNLYLLKTKHQIINDILYYNNFKVYKNSKYKDIQNIKNYLSSIYDKTVNKVLKIYKIIDKEHDEAEQIQNILITDQNNNTETTENKKTIDKENIKNVSLIILLLILTPLILTIGFLKGLCKSK